MASPTEVAVYSRALAKHLHEEHGFICLPTRYKAPTLGGWQKRTKPYDGPLWNDANGCGMKTGREAGITVIDVDAPDREWFDRFWDHFNLAPTTWVETPGGGYHLYFRYASSLPNGMYKGTNIDIRNDGGQIIAPCSYYYTKDAEKRKMNGKKYRFRQGREFDKLRELDDIFLKMYNFGIDRETFAVGTKRIVFQRPEIKKLELSDGNKKAFMALMAEYGAENGNHYQVWLNGVWSICGASFEEGWDGPELAISWSGGLDGYEGPESVTSKCREYNPARGTYGIDYVLSRVSADAKEAFASAFARTYSYFDYVKLFKRRYVPILLAHEYLKTAIVRVDRMGQILFYLRRRDGSWHPSAFPFKGDMSLPFKYLVENPDFDPKKPESDENRRQKEQVSCLRALLLEHQLDIVPNYNELQYLPFYGQDPTPAGTFNVFRGYVHEVFSDVEYREAAASDDFQFMMNHWRETMCNGNAEFFEYVMNWLAWLIRFGHRKPRVAIVMHGREGLGKGLMWVELVWKGLLGKSYGHVITDMARFTEKFNLGRLNKSLHIFNECTSVKSGSKVSWDKMKAIVTDRDIIAEPKGKDPFNALDCAGCVLTGNHEHLVNMSNDDRRYACSEMSDKWKGDRKYFKRLAGVVARRAVQRAFMTYLVKRDLGAFSMNDIPATESRSHMKEYRNENSVLHFLRKLVTGDLGDLGRTSDFTGERYEEFFRPAYNEETLVPRKACWYSQANIMRCYYAYLHAEKIPMKFHRKKSNILRYLARGGLRVGKRSDRSNAGTIKHSGVQLKCWYIDKESIKALHRRCLNDPLWEYPTDVDVVPNSL